MLECGTDWDARATNPQKSRLMYDAPSLSPSDLPTTALSLPPFEDTKHAKDQQKLSECSPINGPDDGNIDQESASDNLLLSGRARVIHALELVALSFLQQVASDQVELSLVRRTKAIDGSASHRIMRWPKRAKNGSLRRFACLLRVIDLICESLASDIPTTKRELFYQDVSLFKTQSVVDDLVDDLAATIGATRADLNVRASAKGLFCGSGMKIHLVHGGVISGNCEEGTLIPAGAEISHLELDTKLTWVLVVEKEAIFQTLCRVTFSSNPWCAGPGIIITGKGYPDLATRELVCRLSYALPESTPIFGLVDADAHGLDILSVYKYGSFKLRHEGFKAVAPRIEWLGLYSSEISRLGIDRDKLLPLTMQDRKKAVEMLRRGSTMPAQWRNELSHMLHSRRKAEIEIISSASLTTPDINSPRQETLVLDIFEENVKTWREPLLIQYLVSKINCWERSSSDLT